LEICNINIDRNINKSCGREHSFPSPKISTTQKTGKKLKKNIEEHMGPKNVINFFFKCDNKNGKHSGSCNIQCLNAMEYKKFGKKMVKILDNHVEFTPAS